MTSPVRLAVLAPGDQAEFVAAAVRSRRLHRPWVSAPADTAAFRAFLARTKGDANRPLVVRHARTGDMVGFIHISNIIRGTFHSAYLGYYAFAGFERQGLMHAGLRLAVKHAFTELKLHRLEANIQPGNLPSIALVRSCGFRLEGYSPRYLKIGGRWRDHERWAILAR
ncbi:MAG: GNAT family N-acetyltransferase [Ramlibacter sp.]|nr:GNAT family protein [Ramlibacter sp.]